VEVELRWLLFGSGARSGKSDSDWIVHLNLGASWFGCSSRKFALHMHESVENVLRYFAKPISFRIFVWFSRSRPLDTH
jgi:hypothetical protein